MASRKGPPPSAFSLLQSGTLGAPRADEQHDITLSQHHDSGISQHHDSGISQRDDSAEKKMPHTTLYLEAELLREMRAYALAEGTTMSKIFRDLAKERLRELGRWDD